MTKSPYVDQSANGLRFTLVSGEVDCGQFNVLEAGHISCPAFHLEAGIIGASHYFMFRKDEKVLTEVLACVEVETMGSVRAFVGPLSEVTGEVRLDLSMATYLFKLRRKSWQEGIGSLQRYEALVQATKKNETHNLDTIGLVHAFPVSPQDERIPKTLVHVKVFDNQVVVNTFHSYPNEDAIVHTNTNITFTNTVIT